MKETGNFSKKAVMRNEERDGGIKRGLRLILLAVFLLLVTITAISCATTHTQGEPLDTLTPPPVVEETKPEGILFLRCSEPDKNLFNLHIIGVTPTRNVDAVGFEACYYYEDGTKGALSVTQVQTIYHEITDEKRGVTITSEDFGVPNGYVFARSFSNLPTDQPGIKLEVSSFYVIGNEKFYTAHQILDLDSILYEHILADPQPLPIKDESPLIEVQKWVKYQAGPTDTTGADDPFPSVYYLGAATPDNNGNLSLYLCIGIPSASISDAGVRYRFRALDGDNAGTYSSTERVHVTSLYRQVITETETLTPADFGLEEGYVAVLELSRNVNSVSRIRAALELSGYISRNAVETEIFNRDISFAEVLAACVQNKKSLSILTYEHTRADYSRWLAFSETAGNALGNGVFLGRVTAPFLSSQAEESTKMVFNLQLALAIPSRFVDEMVFVYQAYDKDGNPIFKDPAIRITAAYRSIFGDDGTTIYPADLGEERGCIISAALNGIECQNTDYTYSFRAYYRVGGEEVTVMDLSVTAKTLLALVYAQEEE